MSQDTAQLEALNADLLVANAVERLGIDLTILIAETAVWANPQVFQLLNSDSSAGVWYPKMRRAYTKRGEKKGGFAGNVRLDDNTYANYALDRAIGMSRRNRNFHTCHVWPLSAYDDRYYTCIANLVLIPRSIAGLSDHHASVVAALKYRSFEIYRWFPGDISGNPEQQPAKPENYPSHWREPEPITDEIREAVRRRKNP